MLDGEIAYHQGDHDRAFQDLRRAVHLDDHLEYMEPWGWMMPARHALGALLLAQGHVEQALAVYRADLGLDRSLYRSMQHRNNVWSLSGYVSCLRQLGRHQQADEVQPLLDVALARADVEISASCFCAVPSTPRCCG
jgi:tetratricopeptide (TPR) repeat protein